MSRMADSKPARRVRRQFTPEFKAQTVRLILDEGKSIESVARELDLVPSAVGRGVQHARAVRSLGRAGLTTSEREELTRLRKENRILQEERDILKNESRALTQPDLWARNSVAYAHAPEAVAVRFLVTS